MKNFPLCNIFYSKSFIFQTSFLNNSSPVSALDYLSSPLHLFSRVFSCPPLPTNFSQSKEYLPFILYRSSHISFIFTASFLIQNPPLNSLFLFQISYPSYTKGLNSIKNLTFLMDSRLSHLQRKNTKTVKTNRKI